MNRGPNPIDIHVGSRVRLRRAILGMSQETLAEHLGLSFQQVQKYEKGSNRISASRLHMITRILSVPMQFFYDGLPGDPEHPPEDSLMGLLSSPEAIALNRAYAQITNPLLRRKVLGLVRAMAGCPEMPQEAGE